MNPAASEHIMLDGNSGALTSASGAGETVIVFVYSISRPQSSTNFQSTYKVPPHASYSPVKLPGTEPLIPHVPSKPLLYDKSVTI